MEKIFVGIMLVLMMIGYSSCDDSFSQVVEIDLPDHTAAISVNALIRVDYNPRILVADSKGILEDRPFNILKDAVVLLKTDSEQWMGLHDNESGYFQFPDASIDLSSINSLELLVEAPGYESVSAVSTVPAVVDILKVEWEEDGGIDLDGYVSDLFSVEFKDPPGENYYAIDAEFSANYLYIDENGDSITDMFTNRVYLYSNDPLISASNDYSLIFNDAAFEGKTARIEALGDVYNNPDSISLQLYSLSKDAFLYSRSLTSFIDNDGNPFAEPTTVHSNIDKGYGIFAVTRKSEQKIEIAPK